MSSNTFPSVAKRNTGARSPFVRSDLAVALAGALLVAVAGAGVASWFGPADAGAAYADSYTTAMARN